MKRRNSLQLPAMNALLTFESAARLGSLSQAARELHTSQPAISRDIAKLEKQLSTRLFKRSRNGVSLTDTGRRYREAVTASIGILRDAALEVASQPDSEQVVIACSHEASHFYLMPRYEALQKALGEHVRIRVLTYHYYRQDLPPEPIADVVLSWKANLEGEDHMIVHEEAVRPLCSLGYAAAHAEILSGPVSNWSELTFLDLTRPNEGWASWDDWFEIAGSPEHAPRYMGFDSYTYVLEAAVAGHGIALGWRYFIERYLESGALVGLTDGFIEFDNHYCGMLTRQGQNNPLAHRCLAFLGQQELSEVLSGGTPRLESVQK